VLSSWDKELAPLTSAQQNSCMILTANADDRPLPDFGEQQQASASVPATPRGDDGAAGALLVTDSIETSQQFFLWFGKIEEQMEQEHESSFRQYNELLTKYSQLCADVLKEIENAKTFLGSIESQYKSASGKTNALHNGCEQLVQEQSDLVAFNESISTRLGYFLELSTLSQKMNSPTLSVLNDQFIPMLTRIDECIAHVSGHPDYKEAALYLARFKQCQNKAMALVKIHVVNTLRAATQHVVTQVQSSSDSADASFTLFYGKFRMHAPRIKMLMQEIEKRSKTNEDFSTLLADCYECYYEQRRALLHSMVTKAVTDICTENASNLPALVRAGCSYIARMCANEYQLYQHFFHTIDAGLDFFLEGLANVLYDACRPLIIHNVTVIDVLVELCSVLRVEAVDATGVETASFGVVAEQMLQDAQQRLCYLTLNFVEKEISRFVPTAADLDYPNKLSPVAAANGVPQSVGDANGSGGGTAAADIINPRWYPTVAKTLVLLSKLYRSVERNAFRDLSLEIVQACLHSLDAALGSINAKSGKQHGRLFMIMHLIVIREQLAPFDDVDFSRTEKYLDIGGFLTSLRGATVDLIEHRTSIFTDASATIFNFLQRTTPKVLETKEDTSVNLENKLKQFCLEYIAEETRSAIAQLNSFNVMVDALPEDKRAQLASQPAAAPEKLRELVDASTQSMRGVVETMAAGAGTYLDKKTADILVGQVRTNLLSAFKRFHDIVSKGYSAEDIAAVGLPSFEAVSEALQDASRAPPPPPAVVAVPADAAAAVASPVAVADAAAAPTSQSQTAAPPQLPVMAPMPATVTAEDGVAKPVAAV